MAVWQFDLFLVPCAALERAVGARAQRVPPEAFESTDWWSEASLPTDYRSAFSSLLEPGESWSSSLEIWGDEKGTRIDVAKTDGRLEEVRVRLDARTPDVSVVEGLVRFARRINCCFVTEEFEIVQPDVAAVLKELNDSSAKRFVTDPEPFLDPPDTEIEI